MCLDRFVLFFCVGNSLQSGRLSCNSFNRCCAKDSTLASNTPVVDDDEQLPSPVWSVYNVPAKKPPMPTESSTIKEVVEEDDDVLRWCRRRDDEDIAD